MLAYFLATLMVVIGVILYGNAFFSPKIHRQDDFLWSGLALFYALVLFICAGRFTGAVLLGQIAITAIAIAFVWENRQLRKLITADSESNEVLQGVSVLYIISQVVARISNRGKSAQTVSDEATTTPVTPSVSEEKTVTEKVEATPAESTVSNEEAEAVSVSADSSTETQTDEEDYLGSSFTQTTPSEPQKSFVARIFGFFRKPPTASETTAPSTPETSSSDEVAETIPNSDSSETSVEQETTATEIKAEESSEVVEEEKTEVPEDDIIETLNDLVEEPPEIGSEDSINEEESQSSDEQNDEDEAETNDLKKTEDEK